jgi:adenylate kinase
VDWLLAQHRAGRFNLPTVINLEITEDVIRDRLHKRGRLDDTEEAIALRYKLYLDETRPLLKYMEDNGVEVNRIDADRDPQAVHRDILRALGHLFVTNPELK